MNKRILHAMNTILTKEQTVEGLGEVELHDTVNEDAHLVEVHGRSGQVVQEEIKDESGNVIQSAMPSLECPSKIYSVGGELVSHGWNMINIYAEKSKEISTPTTIITKDEKILVGFARNGYHSMVGYYSVDGEKCSYRIAAPWYGVGYKIFCQPETDYVASIKETSIDVDAKLYLGISYYAGGIIIFHDMKPIYNKIEYTFTTPEKCDLIAVSIFTTVESGTFSWSELKVTKAANENKSYDHYRGSSVPLPALRGLPDSTEDILYINHKQKRAWVERRVMEYAVTGREYVIFTAGSYDTGNSSNVAFCNAEIHGYNGTPYLCNSLPYCSGVWSVKDEVGYCINAYQIHLKFPNTLLDVEDNAESGAKKQAVINYVRSRYDSGNPIIVLAPLAEPIIEEVPYESLRMSQYYTHITAESEVQPMIKVTANTLKIRGGGTY